MEHLTLAERIEQYNPAASPDNRADELELHRDIVMLTGIGSMNPAFETTFLRSLDAAMTLVPEGWEWRADSTGVAECWNGSPNDVTCHSTTPALALCAASLRARAFLTKQETV